MKHSHRTRPSRARRAIRSFRSWLKQVRACRPTSVSARYSRHLNYTFRRDEPDTHTALKIAARAKRIVDRKLSTARVSWARTMWMGRRVAEGKGTGDRHFQGAFQPTPRTSRKWYRHLIRKPKGNTRTTSPKGHHVQVASTMKRRRDGESKSD